MSTMSEASGEERDRYVEMEEQASVRLNEVRLTCAQQVEDAIQRIGLFHTASEGTDDPHYEERQDLRKFALALLGYRP